MYDDDIIDELQQVRMHIRPEDYKLLRDRGEIPASYDGTIKQANDYIEGIIRKIKREHIREEVKPLVSFEGLAE